MLIWRLRFYFSTIVICISGILIAANHISFSSNTVIDKRTGLIWQTCSVRPPSVDCSGGPKIPIAWSAAVTACEASEVDGITDWRLPNRNELISLMDFSLSPTVDTIFFTDQTDDTHSYWTSTHYQPGTGDDAYYTKLDGSGGHQPKTNSIYAICVRSIK